MALTRPTLAQLTTGTSKISDPLTVLHAGYNSANVDIGFLLNRANGLVSNVALYWNESGNTFVTAFTSNTGITDTNVAVTSYANVVSGSHTVNGTLVAATVNAATIGNTSATLTGTVSTASQPNITTLSGLTSFGTAGVATAVQGNLTVGMYLTVPNGSGQFSGTYNESTASSGVFVGNAGAGTPSPRIGFFNGTTAQNWQMDNYGGTFRWFTPGVTRMQLDTNGNLTNYGFTTVSPGSQSTDSAFVISGNVYKGGVGYHDFMRVTSTYSGVTNPNKWFRLSSDGQMQIINSAYTSNLFNLTDGGDVTIPGKITVGTGVFWSNGSSYSSGSGGTFNGGTITNALTISNVTGSTSTGTGALIVTGGIGVAGNVWAGQVYATNNGNGTNFAVGDDVWIGDINVANTSRLMGQQDGTQGYLVFGNSNATNYIGRSGTNPLTVTGAFNITGLTTVATVNAGTIGNIGANVVGTGTYLTALAGSNINGTVTTANVSLYDSFTVTTTNATFYPQIVDKTTGNGLTYTASTLSHNPSTGALTATSFNGIGTFSTATTSSTLIASGNVVAASGTASTSATTGALVVVGGAGISGNVYHSGWHIPTSNVSQNLGTTTSWWGTFYGVSTQAKYADLAENYQADAQYEPGTVLVFGGDYEVTTTTTDHDERAAGVVSTDPAHLMNGGLSGTNVVALGLTGRLPCRVLGPVNKGTVLVTSTVPGVAQAIDNSQFRPGCVLGKALESINTNSIDTIEIVVGRF